MTSFAMATSYVTFTCVDAAERSAWQGGDEIHECGRLPRVARLICKKALRGMSPTVRLTRGLFNAKSTFGSVDEFQVEAPKTAPIEKFGSRGRPER